MKCTQITIVIALAIACIRKKLPGKFPFYIKVLILMAYLALVRKTADDTKNTDLI
jgi:hypothetical protein